MVALYYRCELAFRGQVEPGCDITQPLVFIVKLSSVQGDHSGCDKPPVDIKTNVTFLYKLLILKRNLCFDVNRRFVTA